jgi:hypothetical protein
MRGRRELQHGAFTNQYMLSDQTFAQIGSNFETTAGADPRDGNVDRGARSPVRTDKGNRSLLRQHYNMRRRRRDLTGNRYPLAAVKIVAPSGGMDVILNPRSRATCGQAAPGMTFSNRPWTFANHDINAGRSPPCGSWDSTWQSRPACKTPVLSVGLHAAPHAP